VTTELRTKGLAVRPSCRLLLVGIALVLLFYPGELANRDQGSRPDPGYSQVARYKVARPLQTGVHPGSKTGDSEQRFHGLILAASWRHSVDPALVKAIIMVESGYDPGAVSAKGAVGLMQLMPPIADALGVKDSFDPALNVNGGVKHLSDLLDHFDGNLHQALAAYNAGIERVENRPTLPKSTQRFVKKVFKYYHYYKTGMDGEGNLA
jgi:soluble lytic murein transglycosylase-like protein